mgnify:CR=1 FL=1
MAFIDRLGKIASKVVAKTLSDPEKSGELLRLGLTAATLPDREDTSQSAFDLGRFRQYNISRQQEDQAKAAALEAQRKAEEKQREREFEIAKANADYRFRGQMELAKAFREDQKETRSRYDKFLTEFDSFRGDTENRHWSMYANLVDGRYVPNARTRSMFEFHGMFGFGSNDLDLEKKGLIAFNKLIKEANDRYKFNTDKLKVDSQATSKKKDQVSVLPGVSSLGEKLNLPVTMFEVPFNSYSKEQKVAADGRVLRSTQDNMLDIHFGVAINGMTNFAGKFFVPQNAKYARELGFGEQEYQGIIDAYKNLATIMVNPENASEKNNSSKVIASGIVKLLQHIGEADTLRKALVRVKNGRDTDGGSDSRVSGSGVSTRVYDIHFYKRNPIMAQVALQVGALTEFEMKALELERNESGGDKNKVAVADIPGGDTLKVFGNREVGEVANKLSAQKRNLAYLLKTRATDAQKKQMEALDKEIEQRYAEAGDEEREDLFFRRQALINRIGGGVRSQKNEYMAAAVYLAAGTPTSITKRNGLTFSTYHMDSKGIALRDEQGKPTRLFLNLQSNLQNVNDLLRTFQRIRTLAEVSEADFNRFGGLNYNVSAPITGAAGELAGRFESAVKFFHEAFAAIRGEGVPRLEKEGTLAGSFMTGTRLQEFTLDAEAFEKKYGYKIDLDPDNMERVTGIQKQLVKGFRQIETDYAEALKSGTLEQQKQAKRLYLRRTAMMWEKAALTYKLAGYVQGEQTGGRTISNQDFDNIYKALWGGNFSSEESAINAVRYLNFTTKEIRDRGMAELFLLETTGKGFNLDLSANNYAEKLYQQRLDRFFKNNPQVEKFVKNNSIELERSDNTVHATKMSKIAEIAQSRELGGTINFTLANLKREDIAKLTKTSASLYRAMGRRNKISQNNFPLAYNDFETVYQAVLKNEGTLAGPIESLVYNYGKLYEAADEQVAGERTKRANKAVMILNDINKNIPRISQMDTILENMGTISEIMRSDILAEQPRDKLFDILESEFESKVGSKNSSILKFFRDEPSFLEYILDKYHTQG